MLEMRVIDLVYVIYFLNWFTEISQHFDDILI